MTVRRRSPWDAVVWALSDVLIPKTATYSWMMFPGYGQQAYLERMCFLESMLAMKIEDGYDDDP